MDAPLDMESVISNEAESVMGMTYRILSEWVDHSVDE